MNRSRKNKSAADETGPLRMMKMNRRWSDEVNGKREREEVMVFLIGTAGRGPSNKSVHYVVAEASAANRVHSMAQ